MKCDVFFNDHLIFDDNTLFRNGSQNKREEKVFRHCEWVDWRESKLENLLFLTTRILGGKWESEIYCDIIFCEYKFRIIMRFISVF